MEKHQSHWGYGETSYDIREDNPSMISIPSSYWATTIYGTPHIKNPIYPYITHISRSFCELSSSSSWSPDHFQGKSGPRGPSFHRSSGFSSWCLEECCPRGMRWNADMDVMASWMIYWWAILHSYMLNMFKYQMVPTKINKHVLFEENKWNEGT